MTDKIKNDDKIHLSNTEELLIKDNDGSYRDKMLQELFAEASRLKSLKDRGASPDDYSRIESILTAVVAAMEVVDKSWKQHHKKSKA